MKPGDRIELVSMPDDPDPIPAGTRGTVERITEVHWPQPYLQLWVQWDNGRTLMPCVPPDVVRVIE